MFHPVVWFKCRDSYWVTAELHAMICYVTEKIQSLGGPQMSSQRPEDGAN